MNYILKDISQINSQEWVSYVLGRVEGTFFHTPYYIQILEGVPNHHPFAFFVCEEKGKVMAMITGYRHNVKTGILSRISSRIVVPSLPLFENEEALTFLLMWFTRNYSKKSVYTEIRSQEPNPIFSVVSQRVGFIYRPHFNIVVKCQPNDRVWSSISDSKRRQIKKAIKSGVTTEEHPSIQQVEDFYEILSDLYKNKVKKPLVNLEYFYRLYKQKDSQDFGVKFLLVVFQGRVIGGIVAPISGNRFIHEHYIAGLDYKYKEQYPSVVATWAAIEYACRNEISAFDFMGAGNPDEDYGVRDFKMKFGGELINSGRYEYFSSKTLYKLVLKGFEIYQKMGLTL